MDFIKKIILFIKYGYKRSSDSYYRYLKKQGVNFGASGKVHFYSPWTINIDIQRPWLVSIGDDVYITAYCKILTHGYDWAVLKKKYGKVLGSSGKVQIGNNVFIGQNTTILKGTVIEDNVIIGAHSLVNKKCEKNSVYAGCPARRICSLDEYLKKREKAQLSEAVELVKEYYFKYKKYPSKELLREFFWLFENDYNNLNTEYKKVLKLSGNEELCINEFIKNKPLFKDYDDFIKHIKNN
jgi:acetyltransferase-like isoleucine patch superfamily enzyme